MITWHTACKNILTLNMSVQTLSPNFNGILKKKIDVNLNLRSAVNVIK